MKIPETSRIIITCNKRLSPFLSMEVEAMGFRPERVFSTGVELQGTVNDCIRLNMHLRCASQVLFSWKRFKANSPEEVYQTLLQFPWEEVLLPDGYFSVTSTVDHFTVNNNLFVNVKVKDAIVDRFRRQIGKRPDSGSEQDRAVVHLFWKEEEAEVFMDTSGETLAKHGYRKIPGKAPMLESLAASAILATNWDRKSPFVNPMCGSSTLAIEAALLATNRFPGLLRRNYGFMHVKNFDQEYYEKELDSLYKAIIPFSGIPIIASDRSEDSIQISQVNAQAADVEKFIRFQQTEFEKTEIPIQPGVIFFNPEYGERMGEISELEKTYALIGDFMKTKCQGYAGYIFTGNLDLAKKIGLKARRRIEFYSGQLDCRLLSYELYGGTRRNPTTSEPTEPPTS
jgi:23S rRNA G2445 N2-methylase RlmL